MAEPRLRIVEASLPDQVSRFRRGDPAAAEALAERAYRSTLRTAAAALGNRDDATDVAQEVTLEVLRGIRRLRDPERFDAWVHRIASRHTIRVVRARRLRHRLEAPLGGLEEDREPRAPLGTNADALAVREALRNALTGLPARQRVALALRYVHDLSDGEIAAALGCRLGTAESLLSRGRSLLRLSRHLDGFAPMTMSGGSR